MPAATITPIRSARNGSKPAAAPAEPLTRTIVNIDVDQVDVGPNVRVNVEAIDQLAASIKEHGVLQPIKVRAAGDRWIVVWGQRRLLAARQAGLERIPAITTALQQTPEQVAGEQLVENLHRADLNPMDRARAMKAVVDSGVSQADLARELGLAPSTIANELGLLVAPEELQRAVEGGDLTPAHARALKGLEASQQVEIAKRVVAEGLSAHRAEELVQSYKRSWAYQAERAAADRKEAEARKEAQERRVAELAKKIAGKATPIYVGGGYYGAGQVGHIAKLIRGAGFTDVHETKETLSPRPKGTGCDCTAWKVEIGYSGGLVIAQACTNKKHTTVAYEAKQADEQAHRELQDKVRDRVQELITEQALELYHRSPEAARIFLWIAFDWSLNDWVRDHKGDRKKPNAWDEICALPEGQLAVELAAFVRKGFTDRYNVKLDWERLALELGVTESERAAPAEPEDTRPTPSVGDPVVDAAGGEKYRIRQLYPLTDQADLAAAGPSWRKTEIVALADLRTLVMDREAGLWRGSVLIRASADDAAREVSVGDKVMVAGVDTPFQVVQIKGGVVALKAPDRGRRVVNAKQLEWQARDDAWQFTGAK